MRRVVLACVIVLALAAPAAAGVSHPKDGWYGWEAGPMTSDDAVYFKVKGDPGDQHIVRLEFRNSCEINSPPHIPKIKVEVTGHFHHEWTAKKTQFSDRMHLVLKGTFDTKVHAHGTLKVDDLAVDCTRTAHFSADHGHRPPGA